MVGFYLSLSRLFKYEGLYVFILPKEEIELHKNELDIPSEAITSVN